MIFVSGPHNAGKTELSKHLCNYGFFRVETGEIVRRKHAELAMGTNFADWATTNGHQFDEYIAESVLSSQSEVVGKGFQDVIVTGNRQLRGIDYLRSRIGPDSWRPNLIIYMEADDRVLFERQVMYRKDRVTPDLTFETFRRDVLGYDLGMGVDEIKGYADLVIRNTGVFDDCVRDAKLFLQDRGYCFTDSLNQNFVLQRIKR